MLLKVRQSTRLGEMLDLELDSLGVLVAAMLAVSYGQVSAWYLLVGSESAVLLNGPKLLRKEFENWKQIKPNLIRLSCSR